MRYTKKLLLNVAVLVCEVALVVAVFITARHYRDLFFWGSVLGLIVVLVSLLKVSRRAGYRYQRPGMIKTTLVVLPIGLVAVVAAALAGVQPLADYKDTLLTSATSNPASATAPRVVTVNLPSGISSAQASIEPADSGATLSITVTSARTFRSLGTVYKVGFQTDSSTAWVSTPLGQERHGIISGEDTSAGLKSSDTYFWIAHLSLTRQQIESDFAKQLAAIRATKQSERNKIIQLQDKIDRINYNFIFNGTITDYDKAKAAGKQIDDLTAQIQAIQQQMAVSDYSMLNPSICLQFKYITAFTLTLSIDPPRGGQITPAAGLYEVGSQVKIQATPAFPYYFTGWAGADTNSNPTRLTISSDRTITASFRPLIASPPIAKSGGVRRVDVAGPNTIDASPVVSIPMQLRRYDWVKGDTSVGTKPPVSVSIQDSAGLIVQKIATTGGKASFSFMAPSDGKYSIVFTNNDINWSAYSVTYTLYQQP